MNILEDSISEKRCLCRACRFNRCVAAGMNPLLIQVSPDDLRSIENISKSLKRKAKGEENSSTVNPLNKANFFLLVQAL